MIFKLHVGFILVCKSYQRLPLQNVVLQNVVQILYGMIQDY
jgi:hypothetical protein